MATWNSIANVGVQDVYGGIDMDAKAVLKQVNNEGLLPDDLLADKPAFVRMLRNLHSKGY